jgi:hypothetical protein
MAYTLGTAALACGANKSTILRSIKAGKIAALRDEHGQWQIEPAELHRVYPAIASQQAPQPSVPPDATAEVALLRQMLTEMQKTLDRERDASDNWRKAFEEERAQRLLAAPSHPTQPPPQQPAEASRLRQTWRWLRSTG